MEPSPLFITRKFPPSVGGMETLAAGVWRSLRQICPSAGLLAHGGSNRAAAAWVPSALARLVVRTLRGRVSVVLTGDALLYVVLRPVLRLLRVPHATMVMGLDVTYQRQWYQAVLGRALRRAPKVIAISHATAEEVLARGVDPDRVAVVPLGVALPTVSRSERETARVAVGERAEVAPDAVVLLTLGRVVRRKGAAWFVREVLPHLPVNMHYVVAGDGGDMEALRETARQSSARDRIHLLGAVDDAAREDLLRGADVFVQPNIPVEGDMEGYGLVTIEAGGRGTPVVAAALEGILDAVDPGRTGILVEPGDADAWVSTISRLVADREGLIELGERFAAEVAATRSEAAMGRAITAAMRAPA